MSQLTIKVGSSVDRSLSVAFKPLVDAAARARAAIEAESKKSSRAIATETKKGVSEAEKRFRDLEKEVMGLPTVMNAGSKAVQKFGKDAATSFSSTRRQFADLAREAEQAMRRIEKFKPPTRQGFGSAAFNLAGGTSAFGAGVSRGIGVVGAIGRAGIRAALNVGRDLAHGAGVETDVGTIFKKNVDLESAAQKISNSGLMVGDKRNNVRVDKATLVREALDVGEKTGMDANTALEGLEKFTSKTGDLATGRQILEQMATYAKATGSSLEDMMDAAGDINGQLDGVEDKGKAISNLMKAFAGQGKLGAVEIRNLASQMAKIATTAGRFEGGQGTVIQMGVLAQMARQRGTASSATQAATSVGAFGNIFSKGKRLDAFQSMGVNVAGEGGKIRSPKELIIDAIKAAESHGGMSQFDRNMGKMFMDVSARRTTLGFEQIYKEAGGGEKGADAVREAFEKLEKSAIADSEIMESFQRQMKTSGSQAEVFNNQMRKIAMQVQSDLTPAMISLAQAVVPAAKELANWVTFLTGDKQAKNIKDTAENDAADIRDSLKKTVPGGKVSDAQVDQLRVATNEAFESKNRAAAEADVARKSYEEKKNSGKYGLWERMNSPGANWIADAWNGNLSGEKDKADAEQKEKAAAEAEKLYNEMKATNDDIKRKLNDKILVRVENIDELRGAAGAPSLSGAGREGSPEERAGR